MPYEHSNTNSAELHARQEVRFLQLSEGCDWRDTGEPPAGDKGKRGRPAGSKNTKKPCSQKAEGGGVGGQEEARNGLQMQVDRLQGLLAAKRAYDEAIVSINRCVDAGVLTSGEAEAQRAEADATLNAAKEAAGVAAARTEIGTHEGAEKGKPAGEKSKPAGEKSKRGRPAGSKNASKKNIYDLSDATLAAVCSDLDLAPAVGSESSVREQRMRDIHAASGSTAENVEEDKDRKIDTDCFVAGLPGKPCSSQLENRNVDDLAASADVKVEGGGGGRQEEASRPSKTEALKDKESAQVLSSNFADDAAPPKSGDEHMRKRDACNNPDKQQKTTKFAAQRSHQCMSLSEAAAALNAARAAAGVATLSGIDMLVGDKEAKPAGEREKTKRGRPAGSKNTNKTRIDDLPDVTLAAVCSDLNLAPAVGSESSVREQRIRDIHAASGSTSKLPKTNLDGLSVATLKLICAGRKLPTSGEDMDRQIYIDSILSGKKLSSQLENTNVGGHAASVDLKVAESPHSSPRCREACKSAVDLKVEGGGLPTASLREDMSAGKQPEKNNITAADDTVYVKKAEESQAQKGKSSTTVGQRKKAHTTMQAATTAQTTELAATFTAVLTAVPAESWSRNWPAERTIMLRMTSKSVRDIVVKLHPPAVVRWRMSFCDDGHDEANGGNAKLKLVFRHLRTLTVECPIIKLELFSCVLPEDSKERWCEEFPEYFPEISHANVDVCRINRKDTERLAAVLAQCPALTHLNLSFLLHPSHFARLAGVLPQCRALAHLDLSYNAIGPAGAGKLAGVLVKCPSLAHINLSRTLIGPEGAGRLSRVLPQCPAITHLDLGCNAIGCMGTAEIASVLPQCPALVHLNLRGNNIGLDGTLSLARVLSQCSALAHLDLSENHIQAEELYDGLGLTTYFWPETVSGLTSQCPALAHLNLSHNKMTCEGANRLDDILAQFPALTHLNLSWNCFEDRPDDSWQTGTKCLARGLANCPALTHLDLSVNSIKSYGAGKLAGVLAQCTALAHLDLSGNRIGDRGAGKLAGVLAQCTALAHLDLSFNRIGHEGAGKLAGVLGQCGLLAHLNLGDNQIRPAGAESLAKVLALCPALTHLDLNNNPIGDGAQRLTESWSGPEGGLMIDIQKTYYGYYEILIEKWVGDSWKEPLKINDFKVPELKKMLKNRGLSTAGLKADLVERLEAAIESSGGDSSNGEESEDWIGWESEEELQLQLRLKGPGYP